MTLQDVKTYPPIQPPPYFKGMMGMDPAKVKKRAHEIEGIVSVRVRDLFPDLAEPIYPGPEGITAVREATEQALRKVDVSMIKPEDSVNILASHHGFTFMGGEPYAEVLRTIKDMLEERTGCKNIRLRAGVGFRWKESSEYIRFFKLDDYFGRGKAIGIAPVDEGVPIETEVGTFYGLKKAYDADWIIHAHNNDLRELYFHREVDRALKPFAMSYARIETRSAYHSTWALRSANFIARAIFESPFVQERFAFSAFLMINPAGVVGVDADNNMVEFSKRIDRHNLENYGKVFKLLGEVDEVIAVFDQSTPSSYSFSAGMAFNNLLHAQVDLFNLDNLGVHLGQYSVPVRKLGLGANPNPAIKAWVINYMWTGLPSHRLAQVYPTIMVSREQASFFGADPQNLKFMDYAVIADTLDAAMQFARRIAKTDNIIIFDGTFGGLNVSESLARQLFEKAPEISKVVDEKLLPMWMKQRGFAHSLVSSAINT